MACLNCGHDRVETYCSRCGQRAHRSRFALRPLLREAAEDVFNLDRGLLHTAAQLSRRPGDMVKDYVRGRTRPYTNPGKYLLICAALATFASVYSGFVDAQVDALPRDIDAVDPVAMEMLEWIRRYFNIVLIAGTPLLAVLSRLLFRPAGYNITEHLIFNVYVYAHQNVIFVVALPVFLLTGEPGAFGNGYLLLIAVYYVWACHRFFGSGVTGSVVRGGLVMLLFTVLFIVVAAVAAALARLLRGG